VLGILTGFLLIMFTTIPDQVYGNEINHCNHEECLFHSCQDNPDKGTHCITTGTQPPECGHDACCPPDEICEG
jgi:hypothetical protein